MRKPVVAGQFYPIAPEQLQKEISGFVCAPAKKQHAFGILSPHAGYVYSGAVAGAVFSSIALPKIFIIIGPNHTGMGKTVSISSGEEWEMPGGNVKINNKLAEIIKSKTTLIKEDSAAHSSEHSIEVQLPFIQNFSDEFDIVPICTQRIEYSTCEVIGAAIAEAIKEYGRHVLIIASSDMTHYESKENAERKDKVAIGKIIELDPEGLYAAVRKYSISMCGFIPATIMLIASKELGASRAELVKYMTSGDVSGDYDQVVGYAGMAIL